MHIDIVHKQNCMCLELWLATGISFLKLDDVSCDFEKGNNPVSGLGRIALV